MLNEIQIGDRVKLIGLPDWLIHDLPESEQSEMLILVGQSAVVYEIDDHGYFWLGFGTTIEIDDSAHYSGHTFCVPREFITQEHTEITGSSLAK